MNISRKAGLRLVGLVAGSIDLAILEELQHILEGSGFASVENGKLLKFDQCEIKPPSPPNNIRGKKAQWKNEIGRGYRYKRK